MKHLSRRQVLNAVAAGAGGLYLPSLLGERAAHASGAPKRLVIFHSQHGPTYGTWKRRFGGKPDTNADWEQPLASASEADLGKVFGPLRAHRNEINILDGLAMTSAMMDRPINQHNMGNAHCLAANNHNGGINPTASSVDQIVGKAIAAPGQLRALALTTWGAWSPVSDGGKSIVAINEPRKAWKTLFEDKYGSPVTETYGAELQGGQGGGTSTGGGGSKGNEAARKAAAGRARMMAFVEDRYKALLPKMSSEDRRKVELHRDMVANLETRFRNEAEGGSSIVGDASCMPPIYPGEEATTTGSVSKHMELMTALAACDVTRSMVLVANDYPSASFSDRAGVDVHQAIAHGAYEGRPQADMMASYYRRLAEDFADLIERFKSVPEGDGTMLDNSLLVWNTQLGNGPHDLHHLMIVTAGSAQGYFKTGRYIKYKEDQPGLRGKSRLGPAHSRFLVSVMQSMGLDNNSIGRSDDARLRGTLRMLKA